MPVEENRKFASQIKAMKEAGVDETGKKIDGPSPDQVETGLRATSDLSKSTGHPGQGIRPCIATLIETPLATGGFPNRNRTAVAIASELKRIAVNYGEANMRLEQWNAHNRPPLKPNEIQRVIDNAFANEYNYGCQNPILQEFCIGKEICPFATGVRSKSKRPNDLRFIDIGWPRYLSHLQTLIYAVALPFLERKRQIGRGGLIFANHHQIAEACGVSKRRVGDALIALKAVGLIEYQPGKPRKWEGRASEIRRVFPVPRPTTTKVNLLKSSDQSKKNTDVITPILKAGKSR